MHIVKTACIQFKCATPPDIKTYNNDGWFSIWEECKRKNIDRAVKLVREAHAKGSHIILLQELFEGLYFCQYQREDLFRLAKTADVFLIKDNHFICLHYLFF